MGNHYDPLLADLSFLFVQGRLQTGQGYFKKNEKKLAPFFHFTFRYIDDVLLLNNSQFCINGVRVVHFIKIHVIRFTVSCCAVRYDFHVKRCKVFTPMCYIESLLFIYVICIYIYVP